MKIVNIHEAETQLAALLAEVEKTGENVRICRHGKTVLTWFHTASVAVWSHIQSCARSASTTIQSSRWPRASGRRIAGDAGYLRIVVTSPGQG